MPRTPSPPPAPDPVATANAQGQMNKDTAIAQARLNMVNQYTPTGSLVYNQINSPGKIWVPGTPGTQGTASVGGNGDPSASGNMILPSEQSGTAGTPGYWKDDPNFVPQFSATTTLSPQEQQIFNTTEGLKQNLANIGLQQSQKIGDILNTPFSIPSNVSAPSTYNPVAGPATYNPVAGPATYNSARDAGQILGMIKSNTNDLSAQILDPVWNARQTALEAQLRNQGLTPGSQAYTNAVTDFNNQRNQAYLQASLPYQQQAQSNVLGSIGAEQSGQAQQYGQQANNIQLGQSQQAQQYGQQANNIELGQSQQQQQYNQQQQNYRDAIQNALTERNQPINEISALMSGSQVSMPQFANVPQTSIAAPNYEGDVANSYAAQMQGYNAQLQNNSATMGGLFGIPSALLGGWARGGFAGLPAMAAISDRRLKTDIKRIGASANGLATYSFRYVFDLSRNVIGYMADEVERLCPEAVLELNGFKAVDYERAVYA